MWKMIRFFKYNNRHILSAIRVCYIADSQTAWLLIPCYKLSLGYSFGESRYFRRHQSRPVTKKTSSAHTPSDILLPRTKYFELCFYTSFYLRLCLSSNFVFTLFITARFASPTFYLKIPYKSKFFIENNTNFKLHIFGFPFLTNSQVFF